MIGILQGIGAASRFSLAEIGRVPRRHRFALAVLRVVVSGVAPQGLSEDGGPRAEGAPARRSAFWRVIVPLRGERALSCAAWWFPWSDGRGRVPRIVDDAGRRGVRERRRVLAHGSRGRVRPGSGRTGARRMGEVVVRGVRPGSGGTGPRTAPHASRHRPSTGVGRDGDRGMPWGCVPVHGLCPRCRTDLGAEPDRLSSRNPTDLGAEPNRSRCGWLSASQGDDAVCTGPGLMGSR